MDGSACTIEPRNQKRHSKNINNSAPYQQLFSLNVAFNCPTPPSHRSETGRRPNKEPIGHSRKDPTVFQQIMKLRFGFSVHTRSSWRKEMASSSNSEAYLY